MPGTREEARWRSAGLYLFTGTVALPLLLAAANLLKVAVVAAIAGGLTIAILLLVRVFLSIPTGVRSGIISWRSMVQTVGASAIVGALISSIFWFGGTIPFPVSERLKPLLFQLFPSLDFIPSLFSLLLPMDWRSGFHMYFRSSTYCFPGPFWWETVRYLRTAVPAYAIVLSAAWLVARIVFSAVRSRTAG